MAGPGPIGRAEIEGHADERDVQPAIAGYIGGAHKRGRLGEARNHGGIEGLKLLRMHRMVLLFAGWALGVMATGRTMADSWDLAEGGQIVRRSWRCCALPERQVVGVCEQRIAQPQLRTQCLWPDTT